MLTTGNFFRTLEDKTALAWAIFSFIGFIDATYLSLNRFFGYDLVCSFWQGCAEVTSSSYASMFGVPVAYAGALFYLLVFMGAILYLDRKNKNVFKFLMVTTSLGFLFTLWLLFVQTFFIEAYCIYCLISATTSSLLFISTGIYFQNSSKRLKV